MSEVETPVLAGVPHVHVPMTEIGMSDGCQLYNRNPKERKGGTRKRRSPPCFITQTSKLRPNPSNLLFRSGIHVDLERSRWVILCQDAQLQ